MSVNSKEYQKKVYDLVGRIPPGRVMTYGQIAAILGEGYTARTVGYVMHGADTDNLPWQRVINSQGKCSTGKLTIPVNLQQSMLEQEGIEFDPKDRCDLKRFGWSPEGLEREQPEQFHLFG